MLWDRSSRGIGKPVGWLKQGRITEPVFLESFFRARNLSAYGGIPLSHFLSHGLADPRIPTPFHRIFPLPKKNHKRLQTQNYIQIVFLPHLQLKTKHLKFKIKDVVLNSIPVINGEPIANVYLSVRINSINDSRRIFMG